MLVMDKKTSIDEPLLVEQSENAFATEAKRLLRLAGPLVASCILQNVVQMVSVMFVGHLGELQLAGASLATSVANVTGFSLLAGMASALDTLCGQAFGARQYHLLGVYKKWAMLVLAVACVPIALVWACTEKILLLIGQNEDIAAEAGAYARWLIPSLVPYVPLACHIRFLQTQSIVMQVMLSSGVTALCHVFICWALIYRAAMGSNGAALSGAISYAVNLAVLALYVRLSSKCKRTWTGFSVDAFRELHQFTKARNSLRDDDLWWSFETSVLSICLNTGSLMFMIPFGLCTAISTRVSNELGAGQPQAVAAKLATGAVMCIALSSGLLIAATMILLRSFWGYVYSNEPDVVAYIARMIPVLAISFFADGLQSSLSGVLTGCGEQKIGARVNLGAFYLAGIPMAVLLAFVAHLNGMGLWLGIVCGTLTKLVLLMWITLRIDWAKEATKAKERVFSQTLPVS